MWRKWKQWQILSSWAPKSLDGDCICEIKMHLPLGRKAMTNRDSILKKQRHHFANKGPYSQSCDFSSSPVQMWELDHKECWYHSTGRKWRGTEESLDEGERGDWECWLETQQLKKKNWRWWHWVPSIHSIERKKWKQWQMLFSSLKWLGRWLWPWNYKNFCLQGHFRW